MRLLKATEDVATLNRFLNDERIRPHIGHPELGYLDAHYIEQRQIVLEGAEGVFWFLEIEPGVWEAHTLYPPASRTTYDAALEAIDYIRSVPDFKRLITMGPRNHPRALRFLEKLGFVFSHTDGELDGLPLDYYELNLCQQPFHSSR